MTEKDTTGGKRVIFFTEEPVEEHFNRALEIVDELNEKNRGSLRYEPIFSLNVPGIFMTKWVYEDLKPLLDQREVKYVEGEAIEVSLLPPEEQAKYRRRV